MFNGRAYFSTLLLSPEEIWASGMSKLSSSFEEQDSYYDMSTGALERFAIESYQSTSKYSTPSKIDIFALSLPSG